MSIESHPRILSLGTINADFQVRAEEPLTAGKTLRARDFLRLGGGKAANVAFLARRLGAPATLIGRVGDDDLAAQALQPLRESGTDISNVTTAAGMSTGVSMITVPPSGEKSIVLAGNANDSWNVEAEERLVREIEAAPEGSMLVMDFEIPAAIAETGFSVARRRGLVCVLDPSFAGRIDLKRLPGLYAVTPNAKEAALLAGTGSNGIEGARKAARVLAEQGIKVVCIKLPRGGCLLHHKGQDMHIPSPPTKVVDTTGAGDAFTGALAVALLEGRGPLDAARFASAASACAVSGWGSQPAYPTRDEVENAALCLSAYPKRTD